MELDELKKKIENILNKHYKETGKIIYEITTIRELNKKFNYNIKIEFKETELTKNYLNNKGGNI